MAAANYSSSLSAIMKKLYSPGEVMRLTNEAHPIMQMLEKNANWQGSTVERPVGYGAGGGASSTFATAYGHGGTTKNARFTIPSSQNYIMANIDRESLLAAKGAGIGAFVDSKKWEVDGRFQQLVDEFCINLFGTGSGSVTQILSGSDTTSAALVYLSDVESAIKFEVGDKIQTSADDGTGSLRDSSATATVLGVDRVNGTLTVSSSLDANITGSVGEDYIFKAGNHGAGFKGLLGWIPRSAPSSGDSFLGVDRSVDPVRLAGFRDDASGKDIRTALIDLCAGISRTSGGHAPDVIVVNDSRWGDLQKELGSFERYEAAKDGEVSFSYLSLNHNRGTAKIITDAFCPGDVALGLKLNTWKLWSRGACPHIQLDAGELLFSNSADSYEIRMSYYAGLECKAPGRNGILTGLGE